MGDNEELSVDQETVDQKVDQPEIGDEPQPQNSTDDFDPNKHTRVQTGANGELCFQGLTQAEVESAYCRRTGKCHSGFKQPKC